MISLSVAITVIVYLIVAGLIFWLLGNVSPTPAIDGHVCLGEADVIFIGQPLVGNAAAGIALAHGPNYGLRKLPVWVAFAVRHLALRPGIPHVVRVRSEKQVCRVDTPGIIPAGTVVADFHPVRDRAVGEFPADPMRQKDSAAAPGAVDDAVPAVVNRTLPEGAAVRGRWADAFLDMIGQRNLSARMSAGTRAVTTSALPDGGRVTQELGAAKGAYALGPKGTMKGHAESPKQIQVLGAARAYAPPRHFTSQKGAAA